MSVTDVAGHPAAPPPPGMQPLLKVSGLKKHFPIHRGIVFQRRVGEVRAVDGIDLEVYPGETIGLVGETGCGKSTTARLVARLLDPTDGQILFDGRDITRASRRDLRPLRREMQMIFQDPYASLNPRKTVGSIIGEPYRIHRTVPKGRVKDEVQQLMELVGLSPEHYNRYPHEFSGGQRQRIGVARALALRPKLIICDEPVSALDVSIQAQILKLLDEIQRETGVSMIFITHDLRVASQICDEIAVMHKGRIVESGPPSQIFLRPRSAYTRELVAAIPGERPGGERPLAANQ